MSEKKTTEGEGSLVYLVGLLIGGLTLGFGIRSLYWSFGVPDTALNQDLAGMGFTGLDNLSLLPAANYSIGMIVLGVIVMVALNNFAWRYTDGY